MMFTYHCKKTGLDTHVDVESLPAESVAYAIRRGLREYFDNYHASETLKKHGGSAERVSDVVAPMVDEAYDRLVAGDVPGNRAPTDPAKARFARVVKDSGLSMAEAIALLESALAARKMAA